MKVTDKINLKLNYRAVMPLDLKDRFFTAIKKSDRQKDLFFNGKVLLPNVSFVSKNLLTEFNSNKQYICAITKDNNVYMFDTAGACHTPNGLPLQNVSESKLNGARGMYGVYDRATKEIVVHNVNAINKVIVDLEYGSMSPEFAEVYPYNKHMQRVVKPLYTDNYIYIDRYSNQVSHPFLYETMEDHNSNKIQTITGFYGQKVQVLTTSDNKRISKTYDSITQKKPSEKVYVGYTDSSKTYTFIDKYGKEIISTSDMFSNIAVEERSRRLQERQAYDKLMENTDKGNEPNM